MHALAGCTESVFLTFRSIPTSYSDQISQIQVDQSEKQNTRWPLFVRKVYHAAMKIILSYFQDACQHGFEMHCSDGISRNLVPRFLFLMQDLEEA